MPEIHIVKGKYCRTNFNALSFVKGRKILVEDSDKIVDEINNPLLKNNNSEAEEVKSRRNFGKYFIYGFNHRRI